MAITSEGNDLFIAAMGAVLWYKMRDGQYTLSSNIPCSPRQILLSDKGLLVNMGINGISMLVIKGEVIKESWNNSLPFSPHLIVTDIEWDYLLCLPQNKGENLYIIRLRGL